MRAGDVLNGYRLLRDFTVVGAGLSQWTFAERGGREYFLKEFLSPTYPDENAPGSEKIKAKKRARCARFEEHHRSIQAALAPLSAYGGNLIVTLDFFRSGAKYYKVTEAVDAVDLGPRGIAALPVRQQLVLMKSLAASLKILHGLEIVHSDLKPSNVLVKRTEHGYTSKLIDFDNAYLAGRPPAAEEIVGTINYYSPELLGYVQERGVSPAELGTASDVFALGLVFAEFLTGAPPAFDVERYHEAAVAVQDGVVLRVDRARVQPALADLVDRMMLADPAARPSIADAHATLLAIRAPGEPATVTVPPPAAPAAPSAPRSGALRGKLVGAAPPEPAPEPRTPGGLVGKLLRRTGREHRS